MTGVRKGLAKVEVALRWDPSPAERPAHDLDIVAAVYGAADLHGVPVHLVHFGSRSPDGTITLNRDSHTGQGFGFDEVMTLELDRMASELHRVVVGVLIQDTGGRRATFADIAGTGSGSARGTPTSPRVTSTPSRPPLPPRSRCSPETTRGPGPSTPACRASTPTRRSSPAPWAQSADDGLIRPGAHQIGRRSLLE